MFCISNSGAINKFQIILPALQLDMPTNKQQQQKVVCHMLDVTLLIAISGALPGWCFPPWLAEATMRNIFLTLIPLGRGCWIICHATKSVSRDAVSSFDTLIPSLRRAMQLLRFYIVCTSLVKPRRTINSLSFLRCVFKWDTLNITKSKLCSRV